MGPRAGSNVRLKHRRDLQNTSSIFNTSLADFCEPSATRMAGYLLSGIFDCDLYSVPELQYGFKVDEVSEQALKLDSHMRAFTSRNLSYHSDSLNVFLGVASRYSTHNGLRLLLGMCVWVCQFPNRKPSLQHKFALSVSSWTHAAQRVVEDAEIYVATCPQRAQFPL